MNRSAFRTFGCTAGLRSNLSISRFVAGTACLRTCSARAFLLMRRSARTVGVLRARPVIVKNPEHNAESMFSRVVGASGFPAFVLHPRVRRINLSAARRVGAESCDMIRRIASARPFVTPNAFADSCFRQVGGQPSWKYFFCALPGAVFGRGGSKRVIFTAPTGAIQFSENCPATFLVDGLSSRPRFG